MYLTQQQKNKILAYSDMGFSSRYIAKEVLGSKSRKSTVNDFLARGEFHTPDFVGEKDKPRILCFDLETSVPITANFGRHKVFLGQDNIIREGGKLLCVGYRWLGEPSSSIISMTPEEAIADDDSRVVGELWELFELADAVVAHNGNSFDVPMLKARVIANGFPPLPTVKTLDTLTMAKRFRFPNNKLDSLAAYFGFERKVDAGGVQTWIKFSEGDKDAMKHMVDYCLHDTDLLHDIYLKLRTFGNASDFNAAFYSSKDGIKCNICGGNYVANTGRNVYTAVSVFNEMRCGDCGAVSRTRTPINTKEQRKDVVFTPKTTG